MMFFMRFIFSDDEFENLINLAKYQLRKWIYNLLRLC